MRQFLCQDNGFKECEAWCPHCWVNIENPDMNDINFLLGDLHMPVAFIESITDIDERPHMDREGDWRLTILRIPVRLKQTDEMPYGTVPISIITNNEIIVTVCSRHTELIPDFISHTNARNILIDTEPDFVLRILYSSAFWYLKYLREISDDVLHDDKRLERSIRNEDLKNMMKLQRTLVFFNTSLQGNNSGRSPGACLWQRLRRRSARRCGDRAETGRQHRQHLQQHSQQFHGFLLLDYLQQCQRHNEKDDRSVDCIDGSHFDRKFLRHERGDHLRQSSLRFLADIGRIATAVVNSLRCPEKNTLVLRLHRISCAWHRGGSCNRLNTGRR